MLLIKYGKWRFYMKLYAIFANDKITGTTYKLFNKAIESFENQGYSIDRLNLYEREKEIPFFKHDQKTMENNPFYLENQKRFLDADALLIVFPLYWYSVPGILKTWLDMINAWAYKYEQGMYARPLHKIKKVFIIYAAMQDQQHLDKELHNPVEHQLAETCRFIGINEIYTYLVDSVTKLQATDIEKHLQNINNFCLSCR